MRSMGRGTANFGGGGVIRQKPPPLSTRTADSAPGGGLGRLLDAPTCAGEFTKNRPARLPFCRGFLPAGFPFDEPLAIAAGDGPLLRVRRAARQTVHLHSARQSLQRVRADVFEKALA